MPDNRAAKEPGQQGDDEAVHHKATDDIERNGLSGALGGVEIGGDHRVDAADDEAPAVFPHVQGGEIGGGGVRAEKAAERVREQNVNCDAQRAADHADDLPGAIIRLQVVAALSAVRLPKERLHPFRRAEEHRHGEAGQIRDHRKCVDADFAVGRHERLVHAERGHGGGELRDGFRQPAQHDFAVESALRAVFCNAQLAFFQHEMRGNHQQPDNLRNARGNGRAGHALLHGEHKQPVQKNIQHSDHHVGDGHKAGVSVVAAEGLQVQRYGICNGKQRPPENIILRQLEITARCAQQTAHGRGQPAADQRDKAAHQQVDGYGVHERALRALFIAAAKADGRDGDAANARHGVERLHDQHKGQRQIDRAKRLHARALSDEDAVHHGEKKDAGVCKNCRSDVMKNDFLSGCLHWKKPLFYFCSNHALAYSPMPGTSALISLPDVLTHR